MTVEEVTSGDVRVSLDQHVVLVTIDRPTERNALTQAMYSTISDALEQADGDSDIGALVITGVDSVFTAGNDLSDFSGGASLDQVTRFLSVVSTVRVPIVAAVNGMAIGVGLTMLLHCDFVYVESNAELYAPFVGLGLVPEAASSLLLPSVVGPRRASELLLSGRRLDGNEAVSWGLANGIGSPVLERALEVAHQLAALPPHALRASKGLLRSNEMTVEGRMAEEMSAFVTALGGDEFAEIMAARTEKRSAVFR